MILLEFAGSPKSGKDSLIARMQDSQALGPMHVVDEQVQHCPISNSRFDLRLLWTVYATLAQARRVEALLCGPERNSLRLVIFNRGLFDAIAFLEVLARLQPQHGTLARRLQAVLITDPVIRRTDLIFLCLTSYEKAIARKLTRTKPGSTHRVVNPEFMALLNATYMTLYAALKDRLPIVLLDDDGQDMTITQKLRLVHESLPV